MITAPDTSKVPNDVAAAVGHAHQRLQVLNRTRGSSFVVVEMRRFGTTSGWAIADVEADPTNGLLPHGERFLSTLILTEEVPVASTCAVLPYVLDAFIAGVVSQPARVRA